MFCGQEWGGLEKRVRGSGPGREPGPGNTQVPLGPGAVLYEIRPSAIQRKGQVTMSTHMNSLYLCL